MGSSADQRRPRRLHGHIRQGVLGAHALVQPAQAARTPHHRHSPTTHQKSNYIFAHMSHSQTRYLYDMMRRQQMNPPLLVARARPKRASALTFRHVLYIVETQSDFLYVDREAMIPPDVDNNNNNNKIVLRH